MRRGDPNLFAAGFVCGGGLVQLATSHMTPAQSLVLLVLAVLNIATYVLARVLARREGQP